MTTPQATAAATPNGEPGLVYVMPDDLDLAVQVALATGRPLLLRGEPGSGKSSMAPWYAEQHGWRYYEFVVTSQTRARDLQWSFDAVRRLADAQALRYRPARRGPGPRDRVGTTHDAYVDPGPLWWAFAPRTATRRARATIRAGAGRPRDSWEHPFEADNKGRHPDYAVVLIDEIDKADPDVPNGLLVPLASRSFVVAETGERVRVEEPRAGAPAGADATARHLIVITTNEERELPQAFLRRCVVARLRPPATVDELALIAQRHLERRFGEATEADITLATALAKQLADVRERARRDGIRPPSTAEYLDALWACRTLGITVSDADPRWKALCDMTLVKPQQLKD
ncbi:MoxR family ATPase [Streptomyces sp. TRM70308]|uniref:AAA family ATPase n=1 Tax=Streptomyces TaxID=1883 RepID=UPI002248F208|nr:MoxR family ATPase [Streptomyces sp. JHD 1]MCX2968031.1 MoxR family ATPase [Streptomyces sp. JHD 1]